MLLCRAYTKETPPVCGVNLYMRRVWYVSRGWTLFKKKLSRFPSAFVNPRGVTEVHRQRSTWPRQKHRKIEDLERSKCTTFWTLKYCNILGSKLVNLKGVLFYEMLQVGVDSKYLNLVVIVIWYYIHTNRVILLRSGREGLNYPFGGSVSMPERAQL